MTAAVQLSIAEARRMALAAQGFDRPRPARPNKGHIKRVIDRLGLLQIDYVTVVVPAQYQVLFSRLGPFAKSDLDDLIFRQRIYTEHWAHEASIVPMTTWPLLAYRRASHAPWAGWLDAFMAKHNDYVEGIMDRIRENGPISSAEIEAPDGVARRTPGSWSRSVPRNVLEVHFGRGQLAIAGRLKNFARTYDLTERIVPDDVRDHQVSDGEAQRTLLMQAARSTGVATAGDLADTYRMSMAQARPRLEELAAAGILLRADVEGVACYLHPDARMPRRVSGAALLSPFDPLIWTRRRMKRLFDFDYRFEIFIPEAKRRWGTYVLPFLLDGDLVARVDLKTDRAGRRLQVKATHGEADRKVDEVAGPLAQELRTMAAWLDLDDVTVARKGAWSGALRAALG